MNERQAERDTLNEELGALAIKIELLQADKAARLERELGLRKRQNECLTRLMDLTAEDVRGGAL